MKSCTKSPEPTFAPIKGTGSFIVSLGSCIYTFLSFFTVMFWVRIFCRHRGKKVSPTLTEIWVILLLLLQIIVLFHFDRSYFIVLVIGLYGLFDILIANSRDIFHAPLIHKSTDAPLLIEIHNPLRWLILAIVNVVQVGICFAILFLYSGSQFCPTIDDPLTALYQSALTFATLGYGEITPISGAGKWIVVSELAFFILFIGLKLPIAISLFKVKVEPS
jgi:hypothetical protein